MLDGRVLEASQVEYKPFGKPPLQREVRLLHWRRIGRTGLSRLARPAVLEVRPEAQPVPPDAGARLRQHGGHVRVPTHGVPEPPRDRREERLQPARVRQRPRRLAQGAPDGGHPTRAAGSQGRAHDHSDAHGVARPPIVEGCCQGSEALRADAGESDVPEGRACRP